MTVVERKGNGKEKEVESRVFIAILRRQKSHLLIQVICV